MQFSTRNRKMKPLKIILGAMSAFVLLVSVWYIVTVRAENHAQRDEMVKDENAAEVGSPSSVPSPGVPGADNPPRVLSDEARDILIFELSAIRGKQVWFVRQANDREVDSFQRELEDSFLESGWEIAGSSEAAISLRTGLRVFVADDELSDHVSIAVDGLRAAGFDVFAGSGYRAFYERQIEKNPNFSGVELAPEQDFVIVVGPKPSAP